MAKVIYTVMSISTAHVPSIEADFGDVRVLPYEYGWVVFVTDPELGGCSDWLEPIMKVAFEINCTLIKFDSEDEVYAMFKDFELDPPKEVNDAD
tara:strand:- start:6898 stop:7179 length:282 start_codon:yes stop_codon:yes gene_type:complete